MTKSIKFTVIGIITLAVMIGAYFYRTEYRETKQIVDIVLKHDLSASFYIRQFHKIEHAKNLSQLQQATEQTMLAFQQAQQVFNMLSLHSAQVIDVRNEYEKGMLSLQNQLSKIKQSNNENDLAKFKKELVKSEQILLNAREKLFNLAQRYNLDIQLKMG